MRLVWVNFRCPDALSLEAVRGVLECYVGAFGEGSPFREVLEWVSFNDAGTARDEKSLDAALARRRLDTVGMGFRGTPRWAPKLPAWVVIGSDVPDHNGQGYLCWPVDVFGSGDDVEAKLAETVGEVVSWLTPYRGYAHVASDENLFLHLGYGIDRWGDWNAGLEEFFGRQWGYGWMTFLGDEFVDRLGGVDRVRAGFSGSVERVEGREGGACWVLRTAHGPVPPVEELDELEALLTPILVRRVGTVLPDRLQPGDLLALSSGDRRLVYEGDIPPDHPDAGIETAKGAEDRLAAEAERDRRYPPPFHRPW